MLAVIQMRKGVEKHIDRHTLADNTELGGGTPWVFSPDRKLSLAPDTFLLHSRAPDSQWTSCARHLPASQQGPGFTLNFLRQTPSCFTVGPRSYTGLPAPDIFLLHSRAPDLHWTFPDLPEHRCYYLSFFPFVPKSILPRSRDPGRAPKCSARSPSPWSGKKTLRNNATCNGGIYYWLEPGPPTLTKGVRTKGPEPQFSQVFIRSKKAAGSWRKRIGYTVARQFLLAQRGAFSFPLIGSLFSC